MQLLKLYFINSQKDDAVHFLGRNQETNFLFLTRIAWYLSQASRYFLLTLPRQKCLCYRPSDGTTATVNGAAASLRKPGIFALKYLSSFGPYVEREILMQESAYLLIGHLDIYIGVHCHHGLRESIEKFLQRHSPLGDEMESTFFTYTVGDDSLPVGLPGHFPHILFAPSASFSHGRPIPVSSSQRWASSTERKLRLLIVIRDSVMASHMRERPKSTSRESTIAHLRPPNSSDRLATKLEMARIWGVLKSRWSRSRWLIRMGTPVSQSGWESNSAVKVTNPSTEAFPLVWTAKCGGFFSRVIVCSMCDTIRHHQGNHKYPFGSSRMGYSRPY